MRHSTVKRSLECRAPHMCTHGGYSAHCAEHLFAFLFFLFLSEKASSSTCTIPTTAFLLPNARSKERCIPLPGAACCPCCPSECATVSPPLAHSNSRAKTLSAPNILQAYHSKFKPTSPLKVIGGVAIMPIFPKMQKKGSAPTCPEGTVDIVDEVRRERHHLSLRGKTKTKNL